MGVWNNQTALFGNSGASVPGCLTNMDDAFHASIDNDKLVGRVTVSNESSYRTFGRTVDASTDRKSSPCAPGVPGLG